MTTKMKRRPAIAYRKPNPNLQALDQVLCRSLVSHRQSGRAQSAVLVARAVKSAAKGLCVFDETALLWRLTEAGERLAAATDLPPMVN